MFEKNYKISTFRLIYIFEKVIEKCYFTFNVNLILRLKSSYF
jgi:hypothetical protein